MALTGSYVKITDAYEGNLEGVVGRTARVVARQGDLLALDISAYKKDQDHSYWDYNVVVKQTEVETLEFEFKDSKGMKVEIGDTVAYGPLGGGITIGKVVDIKQTEQSRWGRDYTVTKVQLEIDNEKVYSDGDRKITFPSKTTRWYEHSGRMLVIQKGSLNYIKSFGGLTVVGDDDKPLW